MDIMCGKCGKHFSSIETAREHRGHCTQNSEGGTIHWVPSDKLTKEEEAALTRMMTARSQKAAIKASDLKNKKKKVPKDQWQDIVRLINTKDKSEPKKSS